MSEPIEVDRVTARAVCVEMEARMRRMGVITSAHYDAGEELITAALAQSRCEGREAGLAQAAERVRWLAGVHRGIGGELHLKCEALLLVLANDIIALPPPGEGGEAKP